MAKQEKKDIAIDADHILYDIASPPSKSFKPSLAGKSLKVTDDKAEMKKLKKAFKVQVAEYEKHAQVESISHDWGIGKTRIIVSDKSNFRYDIFPDYKANRKGREHTAQFLKLRKWARKKFAPKQNIEADDAVAHWVRKGAIGFSTDKDLVKGVAGVWFDCYHSRMHWIYLSEQDAEKFNYQQYVAGDSGDGIKGIEGVALIKAQGLLDQFGWNWNGVLQSYYEKGYTEADAILTRRLVSMNQWDDKNGLRLYHPLTEYIHQNMKYKKGKLIRTKQSNPMAKIGEVVGTLDESTGYKSTSIEGKSYYIHRLVWMYHNGHIESDTLIDHRDQDKTNNNIDNLRILTKSQNGLNNCAKGYTLVDGKYKAQIGIDGTNKYLGTFNTKAEAKSAYKKAKKKLLKKRLKNEPPTIKP